MQLFSNMKYLASCTLLAIITTAVAQQYPIPINPNLRPSQYHPRQTQPQPSYNVNKQIQYQEYQQLPLQRPQYQQPVLTSESPLFQEPSVKTTGSIDSSYTYYNDRNTNEKTASTQKDIPSIAEQPTIELDSDPRYTQTLASKEQVMVLKEKKVVEEEIGEDDIDLNEINDSATRATMLWRAMAAKHPGIAAKAAMYWRVMAVRDAKGAAEEAMSARKMIATGPEEMARMALAGVDQQHRIGKRTSSRDSLHTQAQLPPYWREYASHDPEVTARAAMYWVNDDQADMYW